MSEPPRRPLTDTSSQPNNDLPMRLDALGRSLAAAEATRADTPPQAFVDAVERRAHFNSARRWTPRLALAAAATITLVGGYLFVRTSTPSPAPAPPIAGVDSTAPTIGNLNAQTRTMKSPEDLRLGTGASTSTSGAARDTTQPVRASDSRAADRIDAITSER